MRSQLRNLVCALSAASGLLMADPLGFLQTNLVSNGGVPALVTDTNLVNPWGISFSATSPFWIADNGTGLSTLYRGTGAIVPLVVTVPDATGAPGAPTGTVFNPTSANFSGDRFLFATEGGNIDGWQSGTTAAVRVTTGDAVYKGLALDANRIFATDFVGGKIDTFDNAYAPLTPSGGFTDPTLPAGYAPFGIQNIGGTLYVTYALQSGGPDEVSGPGHGYVDEFDSNGNFIKRLISGGELNSPWGVAMAPAGFGEFGGDLLVGNFGDGRINAFDPFTGTFLGALTDSSGTPIEIDGLWGIAFGNSGAGSDPGKLYFTAGPHEEADGLFGSLTAIPEPSSVLLCGAGLVSLALLRRRSRR
jgi:uncharacterized protein (TIGR03118 family)